MMHTADTAHGTPHLPVPLRPRVTARCTPHALHCAMHRACARHHSRATAHARAGTLPTRPRCALQRRTSPTTQSPFARSSRRRWPPPHLAHLPAPPSSAQVADIGRALGKQQQPGAPRTCLSAEALDVCAEARPADAVGGDLAEPFQLQLTPAQVGPGAPETSELPPRVRAWMRTPAREIPGVNATLPIEAVRARRRPLPPLRTRTRHCVLHGTRRVLTADRCSAHAPRTTHCTRPSRCTDASCSRTRTRNPVTSRATTPCHTPVPQSRATTPCHNLVPQALQVIFASSLDLQGTASQPGLLRTGSAVSFLLTQAPLTPQPYDPACLPHSRRCPVCIGRCAPPRVGEA